jgi:hypothetical protein
LQKIKFIVRKPETKVFSGSCPANHYDFTPFFHVLAAFFKEKLIESLKKGRKRFKTKPENKNQPWRTERSFIGKLGFLNRN